MQNRCMGDATVAEGGRGSRTGPNVPRLSLKAAPAGASCERIATTTDRPMTRPGPPPAAGPPQRPRVQSRVGGKKSQGSARDARRRRARQGGGGQSFWLSKRKTTVSEARV